MGKNEILKSADKITKVSENSIKEYVDKIDIIVATMNEIMLKREDIMELIGGEGNIQRMKDNHTSHLEFVATILETPNSETLVDTLLWVFRVYISRGFNSKYWEVQISTLIQILKENISEKAFLEILSIYNWININIPYFTAEAYESLASVQHK